MAKPNAVRPLPDKTRGEPPWRAPKPPPPTKKK
jgi:hypothetical protein